MGTVEKGFTRSEAGRGGTRTFERWHLIRLSLTRNIFRSDKSLASCRRKSVKISTEILKSKPNKIRSRGGRDVLAVYLFVIWGQ